MEASPELEAYADMTPLQRGQQVILELPQDAAERGADSVIMEVVRVDGDQIHFIAPGDGRTAEEADGVAQLEAELKEDGRGELHLTKNAGALTESDDEDDMEEVEVGTCFLCRRPAGQPLVCLLLGRTASTDCSLAERLSGCVSPLKLEVSTADGVCTSCRALIDTADQHYHQYRLASEQIAALVRSDESRQEVTSEADSEDVQQQPPPPAAAKRSRPATPPEDADSDDEDWTPGGSLTPRSSRRRTPKARRRWSPEVVERPAPAAAAPAAAAAGGAPRGRGRPRKHPLVQPTVIEYTDIGTLKEQVKDIKTPKFNIKTKRPLKADLEKIIHLEVRTADQPAGSLPPPAGRRGRPPAQRAGATYECRRCNIQFQHSEEMVKHLQQHVSKPWCKRCRTEFPDRSALVEHRRACRLQHRSGMCTICDREVKFYRHHMKRHAELVEQGALEEGAPLPDDEDQPPPSVQRRVGKYLTGGVCTICGEHVPERLRKHERSHNITHTCPICKKVFTREDVVRGHIKRVHMKERPHVCAQCGKTFVSVYSLQRHEMIHNNEYRFYCQECGDGFRQKQQLTAHMRHKHGVLDVVFEDVQVMPEGSAVVDAMTVMTEDGAVYQRAVLEHGEYGKEEYVIATADGDDEGVQFTAVAGGEGNLYRTSLPDPAPDGDQLEEQ